MNTPLVFFIGACLTIVAVIAIILNYKIQKQINDLSLYKIHVTSTIDSSIPEILNLIITESFNDYKVKMLLPMNEGYINDSREDEIRRDLVGIVTSRISNAALEKLSLYYNLETIATTIADKVYIIVTNYVVDHNNNLE